MLLIFTYMHLYIIYLCGINLRSCILQLSDFGFAKKVPDKTFTLCGTPEYLSPEVLVGKGYGKAADWWTMGIFIYELLAGLPPFVDEDPVQLYRKILISNLSFPRFFESTAKSLIKRLLAPDSSKRLCCSRKASAIDDLKQHMVSFHFHSC